MAQSITEKIVARAAGKTSVTPGDYVEVTPDYTVCQELSWAARKAVLDHVGSRKMARPERNVLVVDHSTSAAMGSPYYKAHREMRDFAAGNGARFYGAGSGLRHLVMTENGFATPGALILSDEPNIATVGVLGALNFAISSEVVVTQLAETNWICVPRPVRFGLEGRLAAGVMARDLAQVLIRDFAETDTLSQACIEYHGAGVAGLSLDERQSLLACSYHAGADTALMPVDDAVLAYLAERAPGADFPILAADPGAVYGFETRYDLGTITPMVTPPPALHGGVPVGEVAGLRIDQAALGSCANARLDDMRAAARVLKGRRIAGHVTFYITPGSREVYAGAAREGLLEVFMAAGATVLAPGCTTCWGYEGQLSAGEVQISTHQMNYHGRNGSREARSYLASPYTVAASAVAGKIADPREVVG